MTESLRKRSLLFHMPALLLGIALFLVASWYSERVPEGPAIPDSPAGRPSVGAGVPAGSQDPPAWPDPVDLKDHLLAKDLPPVDLVKWLVHDTIVRRTEPWSRPKFGHLIGPPLPDAPGFHALVAELRAAFGSETAGLLMQAIAQSESTRFRELFVGLLAGLKDPKAEPLLEVLSRSPGMSIRARGLALYGLGLLGSDTAWDSVRGSWDAREEAPGLKVHAYWAMGLFGSKALPTLLEDAEIESAQGNTAYALRALLALRGNDLRPELKRLIETHSDVVVRDGALRALTAEPDASTVKYLLDQLEQRPGAAVRQMLMRNLSGLMHTSEVPLGGDPALLSQIVTALRSAPPDVRTAMASHPEIRGAYPDILAGIGPPDNSGDFIWALASDARQQGVLAARISERPADLVSAFAAFQHGAYPILPVVSDAAATIALDPSSQFGLREFAWRLLELGPGEARRRALREAADQYARMENELDRMDYISSLQHAGPDAAPVLLDLLDREPNDLVQMELLHALTSIPGTLVDPDSTRRIRRRLSTRLDQLLDAGGNLEPTYVFVHSGGYQDGFLRYLSVVRDLFGAYGEPRHIPQIRNFATRLTNPRYVKINPQTRLWVRAYAQRTLLESVDVIQGRHAVR